MKRNRTKKAFSLVELLIVISILGIMAAIVMPSFQDHSRKAKEVAAKDNIRILRTAIEMYAAKHNGIPPGYAGDNPAGIPSGIIFQIQLTPEYIRAMPENTINGLSTIDTVQNGTPFPAAPGDTYGYIYKPATKTIRLDTSGTDTDGIDYYDY
jgi:prepilin-type N-terminal cleavage/methylation domain-containing protein